MLTGQQAVRMMIRWFGPVMLLALIAAIMVGSSSNPLPGLTAAPSENNCTMCHSDFALNSGPGTLTVVAPPAYVPGQTYSMKVRILQAGQRRWGFQITALDTLNLKAGAFVITDTVLTQSQYSGSLDRNYVAHRSTGTFPDSVDGPIEWTFDWQAPATSAGPVTFYCTGNAADYSFDPSGDYIYAQTALVHEYGPVTFLTVTPETLITKNPQNGKFWKSAKRRKGLMPNWANLMEETVVQGGFQPGATESDDAGGMRIGISHMEEVADDKWKPVKDSAKVRAWVRLTKWKFSGAFGVGNGYGALQKTLEDKVGTHTGPARGLDSTGNPGNLKRKLMTKQLTKLQPKKHSNKLFAELVALKFNIAASQLGKTPVGFGELVYDVDGSPFDELTIVEISEAADWAMTYWRGVAQEYYDSLWSALYRINRAFDGPIDTVSFERNSNLELKGHVDLADVPFLRPGDDIMPRVLARTTTATESDDEFDDEEFEELENAPVIARLYQNYPNPFNPATTIAFRLREWSTVNLKVFTILGQEVATLLNAEELDEGYHAVSFQGHGLASGIYFFRIDVQDVENEYPRTVATRKMVLLK